VSQIKLDKAIAGYTDKSDFAGWFRESEWELAAGVQLLRATPPDERGDCHSQEQAGTGPRTTRITHRERQTC
jgi:hypothetical protein